NIYLKNLSRRINKVAYCGGGGLIVDVIKFKEYCIVDASFSSYRVSALVQPSAVQYLRDDLIPNYPTAILDRLSVRLL
ncbi:MAG: hypothetical protein KC496_05485, partial [Anaerolineae bacterium]|nr:hypothetical protein [Anaerolineae bacterium]